MRHIQGVALATLCALLGAPKTAQAKARTMPLNTKPMSTTEFLMVAALEACVAKRADKASSPSDRAPVHDR